MQARRFNITRGPRIIPTHGQQSRQVSQARRLIGAFAFARVASLVEALKAGAFLRDPPVDVYRQVRERLQRRRLAFYLNQVWKAFLEKDFAIGGLDRVFGDLYRWGGWLLFTWPAQILYLVIDIKERLLYQGD